ncbi:intercellular adhesion molecule 5-like [Chamaea fasciata]|uniref:intercellular adhesion molecule 5-like n=1 Tax=Chamaea fasciata TaxID=190680 RepID=UPI00336ABBF2
MAPPGPATRLLPPLVLALAGVARGTFTVVAWPRVAVVAFGGSVAVNCSRSPCPDGDNVTLGLETPVGATPGPGGLLWKSFRLENVSLWNPGDVTCAGRCGDSEDRDSVGVIVYQPPQRVTLDPVTPVAVGDSVTLRCHVLEVAPVRNLTVTLRRGAETLRTETFGDGDDDGGSASVAVSHLLTVTRGDHGQDVTCHAELSLRPHGPLFARAAVPVTLSVFALPEPPQLLSPSILEAGTVTNVTCVVTGAFPAGDVVVTAALDREPLDVTVGVAGDTVTATAAVAPGRTGERELSCAARVAAVTRTARRWLRVYSFPEPTLELSPPTAPEGTEVTVTCRAGDTEPPPMALLRDVTGVTPAQGHQAGVTGVTLAQGHQAGVTGVTPAQGHQAGVTEPPMALLRVRDVTDVTEMPPPVLLRVKDVTNVTSAQGHRADVTEPPTAPLRVGDVTNVTPARGHRADVTEPPTAPLRVGDVTNVTPARGHRADVTEPPTVPLRVGDVTNVTLARGHRADVTEPPAMLKVRDVTEVTEMPPPMMLRVGDVTNVTEMPPAMLKVRDVTEVTEMPPPMMLRVGDVTDVTEMPPAMLKVRDVTEVTEMPPPMMLRVGDVTDVTEMPPAMLKVRDVTDVTETPPVLLRVGDVTDVTEMPPAMLQVRDVTDVTEMPPVLLRVGAVANVTDVTLAEGHRSQLQLRVVARRDGDRFWCRATIELGDKEVTKEVTARLDVLYPPELPPSACPASRTWLRGSVAALSCRATGNPVPVVTCGRRGVTEATPEVTAEPLPVTRDRAGTYVCKATNALGTRSRRVTVRVEYPPSLSESGCPSRRVWLEGQRRQLECHGDGDPPPRTRCHRDGDTRRGDIGDSGTHHGDTGDGGTQRGDIHGGGGIQRSDTDDGGTQHGDTRNVTRHGDIRGGGTHHGDARDGDTRDVTRHSDTHLGDSRDDTHQGSVTRGGGRVVTRADGGRYVCRATNRHGVALRSVIVTVESPPRLSERGCPERRRWLEGSPARLSCAASGNPPPRVTCHRLGDKSHPRDVIGMGDRPRDVTGPGDHPRDVTGPGDHPRDVIRMGDHPRDITGLGENPRDIIGMGDRPRDVIGPGDHPRDVIGPGDHPRDVTGPGHHSGDVIGMGDHPRDITGPGDHPRDVTGPGDHSGDVIGMGDHPRDITGPGDHPRDVTGPGHHSGDVIGMGDHPSDVNGMGDHSSDVTGIRDHPSDVIGMRDHSSDVTGMGDKTHSRDVIGMRDHPSDVIGMGEHPSDVTGPSDTPGHPWASPDVTRNVTRGDAGLYRCRATNAHGAAVRNVTVSVEYPPSAVTLRVLPAAEVSRGVTVTVTCGSRGVPGVTFTWSHPRAANLRLSRDNSSVIVTGVTAANRGLYTCTATNRHGHSTGSVTLTVDESWLVALVALGTVGGVTALALAAAGVFYLKTTACKKGEYNVRDAEGSSEATCLHRGDNGDEVFGIQLTQT